MYEAVLAVNLRESWVGKITRQLPISINIVDTIAFGDEGVQDLAEIKLNKTDPALLEKLIRELDHIDFVKASQVDQDKVIVIVGTRGCGGCRSILESGCFLISASTDDQNWVEWKLIMNEKIQLKNLVGSLESRGIESKLIRIQPIDDKESLTSRQEKIIKTALDRGYYDFPKRIGIRELARIFEISTASVSETLRRGQKKIIEHYFKNNRE
ncbi:MAG: helix-turn-helix domain-containing protein [Candidatus Thermoplasmatota archaeon]|nr:helix-turn-helix domain-containing protein [Candidatus Thermoplasmatota archaeon]